MATKWAREGCAPPTTETNFSFGVGATHNVGIPQQNSNQPLKSLQPPPPGLGTLPIGVPPQVNLIQSPHGLINSNIHEE